MKKTLLLSLMTISFMSQVQAKAFFGRVEKYIIPATGQIIEIASNEIEDDGQTAEFYDYRDGKRKNIDMSTVSKSTREEIAGVKAGEAILVTTQAGNDKTKTVSRYCAVFYVFENKQAFVGCNTTVEADRIPGYALPTRMDFIVNNVENVIAQVEEHDGVKKGDIMELRINTANAKAGRNMRVLAVFANGEVLVEKAGLGFLDTNSIVYRGGVDRVTTSDLSKL